MAFFKGRIRNRIPGKIIENPKEKQGYIEDLNSKTHVELKELLERQDKLISNKGFIHKLPDKGERIKSFRERIIKTLAEKDQIEQTCSLLSGLSLLKNNINDITEWTGEVNGLLNNESSDSSFEDETNPLKVLASNAAPGKLKKKKHRRVKEMEKLEHRADDSNVSTSLSILKEDTTDHKSNNNWPPSADKNIAPKANNDPYAQALCNKVDNTKEKKMPFKPHCTTKSGQHPGLHVPKHQNVLWEVTAASPPPPVHGTSKLLTLQESLQLQQMQASKLKVLQEKQAAERLAASSVSVKLGSAVPDISSRNEYREHPGYDSSDDVSEPDDTYPQSDEDENRGTITYTYTE